MHRLRPDVATRSVHVCSGEETPREHLILARVRAHMSDLPERGCRLHLPADHRRTERGQNGKARLIDVIRMEVALVDGKELFAWPGSKEIRRHEHRGYGERRRDRQWQFCATCEGGLSKHIAPI